MQPSSKPQTLLAAAAFVVLVPQSLGCGDEESHGRQPACVADHAAQEGAEEIAIGPSTGATCPDDASMLTYEEFGKPFMDEYCVSCHSSELACADRTGAPPGHDFDTLAGILLVADHIDQYAAAGPDATNITMPPNIATAKPSTQEREMLGAWLACELGR